MPSDIWGAAGSFGLDLPESLTGYLLLLTHGLILAYVVYRLRQDFKQLSARQWTAVAGLASLSLAVSQLFPLHVAQDPEIILTLFAAGPFLLAGAILSPGAAMLVGLFAGLGRSLGQTHYLFDLFHFAYAALLAAFLMQQNYIGKPYQWLRHPVAAGAIANAALATLTLVASFVTVLPGSDFLLALEEALFDSSSTLWSLLIQGALGGGIVSLVLAGAPQLRRQGPQLVSPLQRSLQKRLLGNFILFAVFLTLLLVTMVFGIAINVSTKLVVNQMAHNTEIVSHELPETQDHLQNLVALFGDSEGLLDDNPEENVRALKQLYRSDSFYRRLLLVAPDQTVTAFYPEDHRNSVALSDLEIGAIAQAFSTSTPSMSTAQSKLEEQIVSFMVPVVDQNGATGAVLVGRVPELSLSSLIVGLDGTVGQGIGFIVDEDSKIIAHTNEGQLLEEWSPPAGKLDLIRTSQTKSGTAYRHRLGSSGARELVYYASAPDRPWQAVTVVPYAVVLNLALSIGGPLTLLLLIVMGVFYANLTVMGRDITRPITELVEAARTIASGGKWAPPSGVVRDDELGQLNQAFKQMYRMRNRRLREMSLLLDVSHNVASNIDIDQGMPAILRGALRATGAAGARAIVLGSTGSQPLTFGQGPASSAMALLDQAIATKLRHASELALSTPAQIRAALDVKHERLPVPALVAIALSSHGRFQGVLWLGYRQAQSLDSSSGTLLHTLAGQAAVLVENARLFAMAEGGRRRLAAVLASTTDAFIVTDSSDRVLLINRAMEGAFNLKASEVLGRPAAEAVAIKPLVDALTVKDARVRYLEISDGAGKTFYCNVAPIINSDGHALGRVAVLHDITQLKEIEQMKSDFVATVSHDLRSPLTFMRGFASMLPMVGDLNEKQEEYIEKILGGVDRMTQLVDDLLDLGRIEAGVDLQNAEIDLNRLLSEVVADHLHHAELAGMKLELKTEAKLPAIKGDEALIRQAIANLMNNGFKYAANSGPMVLRAETVDGMVVISVQDRGPGIPKQEQIRLFEKFYRVRQRGTERVKGTGLGLAIVKSIAERHGGRAWCESEPGSGSTFSISLPAGIRKRALPEMAKEPV